MSGSNPGLTLGQIPTPAQWNGFFAGKADYTQLTAEAARAQGAENSLAISVAGANDTANSALAAITTETANRQTAITNEANTRAAADTANANAAAAAQATANAAQPKIAANAGKVLTGPATLGGAPGTLPVGGASGVVVADASGNVSGQTVLAAGSSAALSLAHSVELYPENFGAKGDGVTDDTAAINAYITYVKSLNSGNNAYITFQFKPNSKYLISGPLNFGSVFAHGTSIYNPTFKILGNGATILGTTLGPAMVDCINFNYGSSIQDITIYGVSGGAQGCGLLFGYSQQGTSGYGWSDTFQKRNVTIAGYFVYGCEINRGSDTSADYFANNNNQISTNIGIDIGKSGFCLIIDCQGQWPITSNMCALTPLTQSNPIRYVRHDCIDQSGHGSPFWMDSNASVEFNVGYANSTGGTPVPACVVYILQTLQGGIPRLKWTTHMETLGSLSYNFYFYAPWASSSNGAGISYYKFHWEDCDYEVSVAALGSSPYVNYIRLQDAYISASPQGTPKPLFDVASNFLVSGTIQNAYPGAWSPPSVFNGNFYAGGASSQFTWGAGNAFYWNQNSPTNDFTTLGTSPWAINCPITINNALIVDGNANVNGELSAQTALINGSSFFTWNLSSTNQATDMYYQLATLAASTGSTHDGLLLNGIIAEAWGSNFNTEITLLLGNRGAFAVDEFRLSGNISAAPELSIQAYVQTDGSVQIWARFYAGKYCSLSLSVPASVQETIFVAPVGIATVPAGTLAFDTSTAVPTMATDSSGNLTIAGTLSSKIVVNYETTGASPNGFLTPSFKDKLYFDYGGASASATIMLPVPLRLNQEVSYIFASAITSVKFQAQYPAWIASDAYALDTIILDSNYNLQQATVAGTSGATAPTWGTTVGSTTTDGTVTWTMLANPVIAGPTSIPNTNGPTVVKFICVSIGSATTLPIWWRD